MYEKVEGKSEYDRLLADHKCAINFEGSAAMVSTGVVQYFQEFEDFPKVRIINFIGDGDSKSHSTNPYSGTIVQRLECVGQGAGPDCDA